MHSVLAKYSKWLLGWANLRIPPQKVAEPFPMKTILLGEKEQLEAEEDTQNRPKSVSQNHNKEIGGLYILMPSDIRYML